MKVADKIALLRSGVKFSEIAELEKEELLEKEQPDNDDPEEEEDEQTPKPEEKEGAEKHSPELEEKEGAEKHSPELEEILKKVEALEAENKEMKDYIAKVNIGSKGSEEEEPNMKTGIDVMKELFGGEK